MNEMDFRIHPQSTRPYPRFLLVTFTSDFLNLRFDPLSKGHHLALARSVEQMVTRVFHWINSSR